MHMCVYVYICVCMCIYININAFWIQSRYAMSKFFEYYLSITHFSHTTSICLGKIALLIEEVLLVGPTLQCQQYNLAQATKKLICWPASSMGSTNSLAFLLPQLSNNKMITTHRQVLLKRPDRHRLLHLESVKFNIYKSQTPTRPSIWSIHFTVLK